MAEKGFKQLTRIDEALDLYLDRVGEIGRSETVPVTEARGRVLAGSHDAPRDSPHYDRSAMDGYAVDAEDTVGATLADPVLVPMERVEPVHTGSAMPPERDAVVKVEDATEEGDALAVDTAVTPGENVGDRGEDVEKGDRLFEAGHRLRPADQSLLRTLGTEEVEVRERPRVACVPTGEELVPPGEEPGPGQMVESNGLLLGSTVESWGCDARSDRVLSDEPGELEAALDAALGDADLVLFSGGSSVGRRDNIVDVLRSRGDVVVHGIALSPGKPTALCVVDGVPVVALPGYPAATAVALEALVRPAIEYLLGSREERCTRTAELTRKVYSKDGRRTYTRVQLRDGEALPLRSTGAGILSSIALADGYVVVPEDLEGLESGAEVEVLLT